jgi:hypothetical protein
MGGELMPLPDQKPAPLLLVQVNCLMVASALSRSGAWTVPMFALATDDEDAPAAQIGERGWCFFLAVFMCAGRQS